ncbi:NAD-dependent deacylase [Porphyromonas pogonae]|uniref:SIR2 family NAD-dependent protein deacylase n=1 Tax=Porphyromonas pogonae TaxID=867595 RepID=UPI002E77D9FD|nr:NAD-dependent deacylase [Porphyromonas pogonae]
MKKKLVVLSGAGMSAESGISTFRDSDGLWEKHRVEDVASIEGFERDPALVLEFYNQRRRDYVGCEPNAGHYDIAELEKDFQVTVVTQNVDNLHERAGSSHVIHLHGELMKNRSVKNEYVTYDVDPLHPYLKIGDLAPDGSQLRPFIVWFGEPVPMMAPAAEAVSDADILVVVGTSLNVYPAAGLLAYAQPHTPIFLIDPKPVQSSYRDDIIQITAGAGRGVKLLIGQLEKFK